MANDSLEKKKKWLFGDIGTRRAEVERKRRTNRILYNLLVAASIVLSFGATAAAFLGTGVAAGILPLIVALAIGMESAFKFGEKADFFRVLVAEFDNLKVALVYVVDNDEKLDLIVKKFQTTIERAAQAVPRGQGMQAVKTLYEDLDRHGILMVPQLEEGR